jgi:hypothetical protein
VAASTNALPTATAIEMHRQNSEGRFHVPGKPAWVKAFSGWAGDPTPMRPDPAGLWKNGKESSLRVFPFEASQWHPQREP